MMTMAIAAHTAPAPNAGFAMVESSYSEVPVDVATERQRTPLAEQT